MSRAGNLRRNAVSRTLIFLIAVVQLAIAAAPHTGQYSGATSARAHLHATGDRLETAHDELACPACSNINIISQRIASAHVGMQPETEHATGADDSSLFHTAHDCSSALSRAPPAHA